MGLDVVWRVAFAGASRDGCFEPVSVPGGPYAGSALPCKAESG